MRRSVSLAIFVACLLCTAPSPAWAGAPPQILATWTTNVTATSASLHAQVNPGGLATTYRFEYLTTAAYRANGETFAGAARAPTVGEAGLGSGTAPVEALQPLASLKSATAYRYRITAVNSAGPPGGSAGPALAFATPESGGAFSLLDHRAWELVSPIEKNGGAVQGAGANSGGDVLQAATGGGAVTYSSASSFAAGALGAPTASQYVSRREAGGWSTENITQPTLSGAYGSAPDGVPYQLFSPDLARALMLNGARCEEGAPCPRSYSLLEPPGAIAETSSAEPDLRLAGASPDLRHVVLSTCAALTLEATEAPSGGGGCEAGEPNLYEWGEGALSLINVLPGESHSTPGARLAAQGANAISADGARVYFTDGEDGALYLREAGGVTKLVPETVGGGANFQTASADGSLAFFTKGGELYRYDAATEASEPLATEVTGVLGASEDGSHVYFATAAGIFLWDAGVTAPVAEMPGAAEPGDYPPTTGTARVSPDGSHLAFLSKARLTGYDNTDQQTGEPDSEVYLYEAPTGGGGGGRLLCASCNPTGERPLGPSTIPGAISNGDLESDPTATDSYKPRVLSTDGRRLFFDSSDSLIPIDTDRAPDVYEWEAQGEGACQRPGGCLDLLSSGRGEAGAAFLDASADGSDAFFLTAESLVPSDPGSVDVYDAREGGGFPEPARPIECDGDACQPLPSEPEDPTPGTLVPGPANPPLRFAKAHHHVRHHGKHRRGKRHRARRGRR